MGNIFIGIDEGINVKSNIKKAILGFFEGQYFPVFATKVEDKFIIEKNYTPMGFKFHGDLMENILPVIKSFAPDYMLKQGKLKNNIIFSKNGAEKSVLFFRRPTVLSDEWEEFLKSAFIQNASYVFIVDENNENKIKEDIKTILSKI